MLRKSEHFIALKIRWKGSLEMFRLNDLILLLVLFSSMLSGIVWPGVFSFLQPYPLYLIMFLLFINLLTIKIDDIWHMIRESYMVIISLALLKMIALPLAIYFLFLTIYPAYAISALLLTGISTGVVAPFISNLVKANTPLVLVMVIITSPMVPFTLPVLVKLLLARSIEISMLSMIRMLSMVIFVPILSYVVFRRLVPGLLERVMKRQFPISLIAFSLINLGVFSRYSDFFHQKPITILVAALVATSLSMIYLFVGPLFLLRQTVENQLAAAITLGNINNLLVVVFASQFFSPLEPTVAAMYQIPFFALILPLRLYQRWRKGRV